jgi:hypothetical protein
MVDRTLHVSVQLISHKRCFMYGVLKRVEVSDVRRVWVQTVILISLSDLVTFLWLKLMQKFDLLSLV